MSKINGISFDQFIQEYIYDEYDGDVGIVPEFFSRKEADNDFRLNVRVNNTSYETDFKVDKFGIIHDNDSSYLIELRTDYLNCDEDELINLGVVEGVTRLDDITISYEEQNDNCEEMSFSILKLANCDNPIFMSEDTMVFKTFALTKKCNTNLMENQIDTDVHIVCYNNAEVVEKSASDMEYWSPDWYWLKKNTDYVFIYGDNEEILGVFNRFISTEEIRESYLARFEHNLKSEYRYSGELMLSLRLSKHMNDIIESSILNKSSNSDNVNVDKNYLLENAINLLKDIRVYYCTDWYNDRVYTNMATGMYITPRLYHFYKNRVQPLNERPLIEEGSEYEYKSAISEMINGNKYVYYYNTAVYPTKHTFAILSTLGYHVPYDKNVIIRFDLMFENVLNILLKPDLLIIDRNMSNNFMFISVDDNRSFNVVSINTKYKNPVMIMNDYNSDSCKSVDILDDNKLSLSTIHINSNDHYDLYYELLNDFITNYNSIIDHGSVVFVKNTSVSDIFKNKESSRDNILAPGHLGVLNVGSSIYIYGKLSSLYSRESYNIFRKLDFTGKLTKDVLNNSMILPMFVETRKGLFDTDVSIAFIRMNKNTILPVYSLMNSTHRLRYSIVKSIYSNRLNNGVSDSGKDLIPFEIDRYNIFNDEVVSPYSNYRNIINSIHIDLKEILYSSKSNNVEYDTADIIYYSVNDGKINADYEMRFTTDDIMKYIGKDIEDFTNKNSTK